MSTDGRALPAAVAIREVGLRDGLQLEDPVSTGDKLALLAAIAATGVRRIELTAFVSPRAVPAMADAEELAARAREVVPDSVELSALVAGPGGARRAVAAGITTVEYVISAADGHSRANVRASTEEAVARTAEVAAVVHEAGGQVEAIIATAFDCPFDGTTDPDRVVGVAARALELGADTLAIADTIGTAVPGRVLDLVARIRAALAPTRLGAHFHDTRGAGLACAWAAVTAGVTELDASVGGLGGCPFAPGATGNIATEELVYLLEDSGVATGMDLAATLTAAAETARIVGHPVPSGLLRAGDRKR